MDFGFWRGCLLASLCASGLAAADAPRLDPGLDLQRQQQGQRLRQDLNSPTSTPISTPTISVPKPGDATCLPVQAVAVEGVSRLTPARIQQAVAPYIGRCLGAADLNNLLASLNDAYVRAGYVTSRVYLRQQRVQGGTLRLVAIEGRIAAIRLNGGNTAAERRRVAAAFPTGPGQVLRLPDIEQGMDQLNRAPSAQAVLAVQPGAETGESVLLARSSDARPWRAGLTLDNAGEPSTGRGRLLATLGADNLLSINDSWQLAATHSPGSNAVSLSPVFPLGYWTATASLSRADYLTTLDDGYSLDGSSSIVQAGLERLFYRNQHEQLTALLGVGSNNTARSIADVPLQNDRSASADVGLRWLHRESSRAWYLETRYVRGTGWFDASSDDDLPSSAPHHQFGLLQVQGRFSAVLGSGWDYSADLQGQYANRGLIANEQIVLGGSSSLRGFSTAAAYGDSGLALRNTASHACLGLPTGWRCSAFLDAGLVRALAAPPTQELLGGGGGIRYEQPHFFTELNLGLPLHVSSAVPHDRGELYMQLGENF